MINENVNFVLDIDGVILDYVSGFMSWMRERQGLQTIVAPDKIERYDLSPYFHRDGEQITFSEFRERVSQFSLTEEFKHIPAFEGAEEFLQELSNSGFKIHAVTSCGNEVAAKSRKYCLERYVGWQSNWPLHVLPLGASKQAILSKFPKGRTFFLDDLHSNIQDARKVGLTAIWHKSAPETVYRDIGEGDVLDETHTGSWIELKQKLEDHLIRLPASPDQSFTVGNHSALIG